MNQEHRKLLTGGVSLSLEKLWIAERVNIVTGSRWWDSQSVGFSLVQVKVNSNATNARYGDVAAFFPVARYVEFAVSLTGQEELVEPKEQEPARENKGCEKSG